MEGDPRRWEVGAWTVTRVPDPGFELTLPQDEATVRVLQTSPWLAPDFVTDAWALRVGSSAILVTGPGPSIVVDPWLAFDDPARLPGRLEALREAGTAPEDVDIVVNTHFDGIGANVAADGCTPAFPNARYLLPGPELATIRGAPQHPGWPLAALADAGVLETVEEGAELAEGVEVVDLPGHNPGHVGVRVEGAAVIVGHLFLHPAQVANPTSMFGDHRPDVLLRTREDLLSRAAADGTLLVGPLWVDPGAGYVVRDGDRWALRLPAG